MTENTGIIKQNLLEQAIQAVARETGTPLQVIGREIPLEGHYVDALLRLEGSDREIPAEIRNWAQHANLGALIQRIQQLPRKGMLVADYVNPRMADKLRQRGIQFIDTAGNSYIDQPPVFVYVTGRKRHSLRPPQQGGGAAFETKGLQVVFAFLCHPELVNASYRDIAIQTGVAVGTVSRVINGLKSAGFIRESNSPKKRRLVQCPRLLARWVETYPEKLRPKLWMGEFASDDPQWWQRIDVTAYGGCWGGEPAAARYSEGYLRPQVATLYLPEQSHTRLLRDARLRKITEWDGTPIAKAILYRPFWPELSEVYDNIYENGVVHPILAYADLIATAEPRNLEAANQIHDQYIARYCRAD